ncbi:Uncharacterised protein [Staphylococcus aureus]|nr:Uncharacterised protein [Staphylococcus aureus]
MKSILSKIVPAPNLTSFKIPKDKVAGILMINTKILPITATFLRFVLSFFVKLETFNSNKEIDDVKAANKNSTKNPK